MGDSGKSNRERVAAGEWDDAEQRLIPLVQTRFQEAVSRDVQFVPLVGEASSATEPEQRLRPSYGTLKKPFGSSAPSRS